MKKSILLLVMAIAAQAKELRFAMAGDPKTFDPLQVADSNSETIRYLTAGVLVRIDRVTGKVEPELAESWKITDGGRSIAFKLRPGLKFSDGASLTASDVARTLRRALDSKEVSPAGEAFRSAAGDPEIAATSPVAITIRYKTVKPSIERSFDSLGIAPAVLARIPASAGAFHVAEYKPGDYVRLVRNPNYWKRDASGRQLPYLDSIRIDIQQNRDAELTRFLRGELQLVNKVDPEAYDRVKKQQPASAQNLGASLDAEFLWFNQSPAKTLPEWKRRWFTSSAFRHAIGSAIHRDDLTRLVFHGHAHAALGPTSSANRFWFNAALKPQPLNAAQLLGSDGFTLKDGVLRDRQGHAVEFSLITSSGNRPRERMAALIQSDLKAIGVRVNIVPLEFGSMLERIGKSLDYEAALLGFANVEEDPLEQMNIWLSSAPQHPWFPSQKTPATTWEARIDRLEMQQAGDADRASRKKAMDEVQRIVLEQEPVISLVNPDYLCAVSPRLKGLKPGISPPQLLWNVEWLQLE